MPWSRQHCEAQRHHKKLLFLLPALLPDHTILPHAVLVHPKNGEIFRCDQQAAVIACNRPKHQGRTSPSLPSWCSIGQVGLLSQDELTVMLFCFLSAEKLVLHFRWWSQSRPVLHLRWWSHSRPVGKIVPIKESHGVGEVAAKDPFARAVATHIWHSVESSNQGPCCKTSGGPSENFKWASIFLFRLPIMCSTWPIWPWLSAITAWASTPWPSPDFRIVGLDESLLCQAWSSWGIRSTGSIPCRALQFTPSSLHYGCIRVLHRAWTDSSLPRSQKPRRWWSESGTWRRPQWSPCCRITSHSSVACSMVTACLDGGTAASGQSGQYKPKCESLDQHPITQHLRESLSTGMWFDHLTSSCLQLLISVGLEAVHVAVCGIGDCKTAVHQVSVDLFHHSCGLLTHLQRVEGRLSGQIAPFTRNMWSFDIGKVVASSKCGASRSAISKASLLLHHMVHKVHRHSLQRRHRPCGVLGDSKRSGHSWTSSLCCSVATLG